MNSGLPRSVVVVGGGSWSEVIVTELLRFQPFLSTIHWVSQSVHGGTSTPGQRVLARQETQSGSASITVWRSVDEFLDTATADAAFVVNTPSRHESVAGRLLSAGIHTMVEKPVALNCPGIAALIGVAGEKNLLAAAGLEFLVAPFVREFRRVMEANWAKAVSRVEIVWHDSPNDVQRGAPRRFDRTVNVVADLFPHALSFLAALFGHGPMHLSRCASADGGWSAELDLTYRDIPVSVSLSRVASNKTRQLRVTGDPNDLPLVLNFGAAPAEVDFGNGTTLQLPASTSPVQEEIHQFLTACKQPDRTCALSIKETLSLHLAVVEAHQAIQREQVRLLSDYLLMDGAQDSNVRRVLTEHLFDNLLEDGLISHPFDEQLDRYVCAASVIVARLSRQPFATQAELMAQTRLTIDELRALNQVLRRTEIVQATIVDEGLARKYWQNTILPLRSAGSIDATIEGRHVYPFRVGLYPGLSCMFFCTFCGRNYDAAYRHSDIASGNEIFSSLIDQAPVDDPNRFYISGGLEPLTNPGLSDLVERAANRGFDLSLYTNGFMLTRSFLDRRPGLWQLGTLRVSLYGPDENSMFQVTRKANAFERVVVNVKDFLQQRQQNGSAVRFGFNYVVFPGNVDRVLDVVALIARLNKELDGRGVDFLTLREDYSVPNGGFEPDERARLYEIFSRVSELQKNHYLRGVTIDYGYALDAIRRGLKSEVLAYVEDGQVRATGFPQVSLVVDPLGDVYMYREAGFLDRPGAKRYILGRISPDRGFEHIVRNFVESRAACEVHPGDTCFFDAFDHGVTLALHQAEEDTRLGIPPAAGPVNEQRCRHVLAHPTLPMKGTQPEAGPMIVQGAAA